MTYEKRCFEVRNILQFSYFNMRYINLTSKCLKMLSLIEQQLSLLLLQRNTNASGFLSLYCNCFCLHNHSRYFYIKRFQSKNFSILHILLHLCIETDHKLKFMSPPKFFINENVSLFQNSRNLGIFNNSSAEIVIIMMIM